MNGARAEGPAAAPAPEEHGKRQAGCVVRMRIGFSVFVVLAVVVAAVAYVLVRVL